MVTGNGEFKLYGFGERVLNLLKELAADGELFYTLTASNGWISSAAGYCSVS